MGGFFVDALLVIVVVTTVRVSVAKSLFVFVVEPVFVSKLSTGRFFPCMLSHINELLRFRNRLTGGIVCCGDPGCVGGAVVAGWVVPLGSRFFLNWSPVKLNILFEFFVRSFSGWW